MQTDYDNNNNKTSPHPTQENSSMNLTRVNLEWMTSHTMHLESKINFFFFKWRTWKYSRSDIFTRQTFKLIAIGKNRNTRTINYLLLTCPILAKQTNLSKGTVKPVNIPAGISPSYLQNERDCQKMARQTPRPVTTANEPVCSFKPSTTVLELCHR